MALDDVTEIVFSQARTNVRNQLIQTSLPPASASTVTVTATDGTADLFVDRAGWGQADSPSYRLSTIDVSAGQGAAVSHLAGTGRRFVIPVSRNAHLSNARDSLNQVITRRRGLIIFRRNLANGNFDAANSRRAVQVDYHGERQIETRQSGGRVTHRLFFYSPFPWLIGNPARSPASGTGTSFNISLPAGTEGPMAWAIETTTASGNTAINFTVNNFRSTLTSTATGGAQFFCPTPEFGEASGRVSGFLPPYLEAGTTYTFTSSLACAVYVFPSYLSI